MPVKYSMAALLLCCSFPSAQAGLYSDELAKCLVANSSQEDRIDLVRWMFTAASFHPAVESLTSVSPAEMAQVNRSTGQLFMRLMTEDCREQARDAIAYEGVLAIQGGFQVLGQVAGQELFSSPSVAAGITGLQQYIDEARLKDLMK